MQTKRERPLKDFFLPPKAALRQVIAKIDFNEKGIVLIVDSKKRLLGTVTDGDVRRAVLAGKKLTSTAETLLRVRKADPVTAPAGTSDAKVLKLMRRQGIRHVPLLDSLGVVTGLKVMEDFLPRRALPVHAVIAAGGYGTRLLPLTEAVPKPMLRLGREPVLTLLIRRIRKAGIKNVSISTHYKSSLITSHFGRGTGLGVRLQYLIEKKPLGTGGFLGLMKKITEPLLVINGDILSNVNFRAMLDFHREHKADMTVAVHPCDVKMRYGVVETEGGYVRSILEKPNFSYFANAGIYILEPKALEFMPASRRFDMPELVERLLRAGRAVASFPLREYWLDMGNAADYQQAQMDLKEGRYRP